MLDYFQDISTGEALNDMLNITIRSLVSVIILFILAKWMGNKQISQLSFFDYVVGITIGSIAAELAVALDSPHHFSIIALFIYAAVAVFVGWLSIKNFAARKFFIGVPIILINKGAINYKALRKNHITVNDLLSECRIAGYFDISAVSYCFMETNGTFSFIPIEAKRPLTPEDFDKTFEQTMPVSNVIIDGQIMKESLNAIGKSPEWLHVELAKKKLLPSDVLLATVDSNSKLQLYKKIE